MAKNHYTTKAKRRSVSGKRVDQGAETMRILKVRALVAELDDEFANFRNAHGAEIERLTQMKDEDIDTTDIPEVTDWSGAEIGKFYRPAEPTTIGECLQDSLGGIPADILADVHEDEK
jgi:hypothetical protein